MSDVMTDEERDAAICDALDALQRAVEKVSPDFWGSMESHRVRSAVQRLRADLRARKQDTDKPKA